MHQSLESLGNLTFTQCQKMAYFPATDRHRSSWIRCKCQTLPVSVSIT